MTTKRNVSTETFLTKGTGTTTTTVVTTVTAVEEKEEEVPLFSPHTANIRNPSPRRLEEAPAKPTPS
jgi:hypothetical protein